MGDWLLTVPLLLIELILVMELPAEETKSLSVNLGVASAVMVALGYPGEIQDDLAMRWIWWAAAMVPFCYVVKSLVRTRRGHLQAAGVCEGPCRRCPLPDRRFVAHVPLC